MAIPFSRLNTAIPIMTVTIEDDGRKVSEGVEREILPIEVPNRNEQLVRLVEKRPRHARSQRGEHHGSHAHSLRKPDNDQHRGERAEREELACMPYPAHGYLLDELRKQTIRPCMRDNGFQERVEAARQRYAFRRALRGKVEDCRADADETQRDEGASRISHSCRPSSDRASSLQGFIDLL